MTIYDFFAIFIPVIAACVTIIMIFTRIQSVYATIYDLQAATKAQNVNISDVQLKLVDIPLPNFEEISRQIISAKNDIEQLKNAHENLAESFTTYQNKMASRLNQEKREKRRKEEPEEEEQYGDLSTLPDTGEIVDRRDISQKPTRLVNKVKFLAQRG
jgi:hypothetical protein